MKYWKIHVIYKCCDFFRTDSSSHYLDGLQIAQYFLRKFYWNTHLSYIYGFKMPKIWYFFIAFVRTHYISKGVRKFKQRWKNKNYFVPWGGKISCLKKTEIVCKIEGDKRGATLLSYSDLIFWVIKVGFDIL